MRSFFIVERRESYSVFLLEFLKLKASNIPYTKQQQDIIINIPIKTLSLSIPYKPLH